MVARLRQQTYQRLLLQETEFFQGVSKGDLLSRLSSDAQLIQTALTNHVVSALRGVVVSVGSTGMIITMSPTLAALSLSTLPPIFVLARTMGRTLQKDQKQVQKALGEATTMAEQALHGMDTVKQYGAESFESHRYNVSIAKAHGKAVETAHRQAQLECVTHICANGAVLAVLGYGGTLVLRGNLTPGDLAGFVLYSFMLAGNLSNLSSLYADVIRAMAASERVVDILDRTPRIPAPIASLSIPTITNPMDVSEDWLPPDVTAPSGAATITIRDLSFAYSSRPETKILDGLNLRVDAGQAVALVGASGSGKSTVAKLLTRLYEVPPNTIFLDGQCIALLPTDELRHKISVVSQEPVLFQGTILDNIRYGSWSASDDNVMEAAVLANVMEFVERLPDGLNTHVTSTTLSGGQRQRIAIARAMVKKASLVILDEATASLDAQSEHYVQQAMDKIFQQQKTVISIAHRMSTIRHSREILVLDEGRIIQQGSFENLAADRTGAFWNLMKTQLLDCS